MFVALSHCPGLAKCDFGEAWVVIGGAEQKAHYFVMDLPHSDVCYMNGDGGWGLLTNVGAETTTYTDTTLTGDTSYWYRVYVYDYAGQSACSNEDLVTTELTDFVI